MARRRLLRWIAQRRPLQAAASPGWPSSGRPAPPWPSAWQPRYAAAWLSCPGGHWSRCRPPELDDVRAELFVRADGGRADRLHRALRDVAHGLAGTCSDARPRLVQVGPRRIEVVLSSAVLPPPPGWKAEASGAAWTLAGEPLDGEGDGPAPAPALVSFGSDEPGTELYLDLEAEGVVCLVGATGPVADVARSWIIELASSPLAAGAARRAVAVEGRSPDRAREVGGSATCHD